jgi:flagellar biosynthetic protein FlhB
MPENDGDKTEKATPRRRQKAVEEGNVPKSKELPVALSLVVVTVFMYFYTPVMIEDFKKLVTEMLQYSNLKIDKSTTNLLLILSFNFAGKVLLPLASIILFIGVLSNIAQFGFIITPKALEPKFERLNPLKGLKNLFSKRSLVELIKSLFKIFVVGFVAYLIVKSKIPEIISLANAESVTSISFLGKLVFELAFKIAILMLLLALLDFLYQKWQYEEDLKMTKQEVKEEFKQMEGDPLIKQRIRSMQREMARRRMMEEVPKADVVITNPTHYAVAIKYESGKDRAPVVIAKGQRLVALRIKELAIKHGIIIHEDPPVARSLFNSVEIGDEIPESLYKAVAEILAIVYKMKNKRKIT